MRCINRHLPSYLLYYSNTVIDTLDVDGWSVTFGTAKRAWTGPQPAQAPPRCTKYNSPPINGQSKELMQYSHGRRAEGNDDAYTGQQTIFVFF